MLFLARLEDLAKFIQVIDHLLPLSVLWAASPVLSLVAPVSLSSVQDELDAEQLNDG